MSSQEQEIETQDSHHEKRKTQDDTNLSLPPIKAQTRAVPFPQIKSTISKESEHNVLLENDKNVKSFYSRFLNKRIKNFKTIAEDQGFEVLQNYLNQVQSITADSRNLTTQITTTNDTSYLKVQSKTQMKSKYLSKERLNQTFDQTSSQSAYPVLKQRLGMLYLEQSGESPLQKKNQVQSIEQYTSAKKEVALYKSMKPSDKKVSTQLRQQSSKKKTKIEIENLEQQIDQTQSNQIIFQIDNQKKNSRMQLRFKSQTNRIDSVQDDELGNIPNQTRKFNKINFSEYQSRFKDSLKLKNPLKDQKYSLFDKVTISKMKAHGKYPIQEALLLPPPKYQPNIDSLMNSAYNSDNNEKWADYQLDIDAPNCSQCSDEKFDLNQSDNSDYDLYDKSDKSSEEDRQQNGNLLTNQRLNLIADLEELKKFPDRIYVSGLPLYVVKGNSLEDIITKSSKMMKEETQNSKEMIKHTRIQEIFEYYCSQFNVLPINLMQFYKEKERVLEINKYFINESSVKAIACTIPFITDLEGIVFDDNQISDQGAAVLLLALYHTPNFKIFNFKNNKLQDEFVFTFQKMTIEYPDMIQNLTLAKAKNMGNFSEMLCQDILLLESLITLNLSGVNLNPRSCKHIGQLVSSKHTVKDLNISNCNIRGQGTRYILEGIDFNKSVNFFNFAFNDLTSESYEFSSKLGKIICRHSHLMHVDLTCTGLKKEEVLFIGLSINQSQSIISLHLSGNEINYYERVYLRQLLKARVIFPFKNTAEQKEIKTLREQNQVRALISEDYQSPDVKSFLENRMYLDYNRENLDFESNMLLDQIDLNNLVQLYKDIEGKNENSQNSIHNLMQHFKEKSQQIENTMNRTKFGTTFHSSNGDEQEIYDAIRNVEDPKRLSQYNRELNSEKSVSQWKSSNQKSELEAWDLMKKLKKERMKQRFEQAKRNQKRQVLDSRMEMLRLGKVAFDTNLENPMTGYMNDVIFTRILGHDDILMGDQWKDTTQCWICEQWAKQTVIYSNQDELIMRENNAQLEQLKRTIQDCINSQTQIQTQAVISPHHLLSPKSQAKSKEWKSTEWRKALSEGRTDSRKQQSRISKYNNQVTSQQINDLEENLLQNKIDRKIEKMMRIKELVEQTQPLKYDERLLHKQIIPENFENMVEFKSTGPVVIKRTSRLDDKDKRSTVSTNIRATMMKSKREHYPEDSEEEYQQDPDMTVNYAQEMSQQQQSYYKTQRKPEELDFDDIYLIASFNNWFPIKMHSQKQVHNLNNVDIDKPTLNTSSGKSFQIPPDKNWDENLMSFADFLPPGKHFFYFVKNLRNYFLSPRYPIVKFKQTHLYLNQLIVQPRLDPIVELIIKKADAAGLEKKFIKDKSVFKPWKEENDEILRKMFESDIGYSKLHRILKSNEEEMNEVKETLFKYYVQLKNIFILYASISTYPVISWQDFTNFCYKCKLIDNKTLNLSTLDRIFITTNVALHKFSSSAERSLQRYEFLEIIVRLANAKFKETSISPTTSEALEKLINEHILPNAEYVDSKVFRENTLYTYDVNEILARNELPIRKLYESFIHANKKFLTLRDCIELLNKRADIKLIETTIGFCFAQSLMPIIDPVRDQTRMDQMKHVEFLEFIGRIAYEYFRDSPDEDQQLHIKIDKLLGPLLKVINQQKSFTFLQPSNTQPNFEKKSSMDTEDLENEEYLKKKSPTNLEMNLQQAIKKQLTRRLNKDSSSYQIKN